MTAFEKLRNALPGARPMTLNRITETICPRDIFPGTTERCGITGTCLDCWKLATLGDEHSADRRVTLMLRRFDVLALIGMLQLCERELHDNYHLREIADRLIKDLTRQFDGCPADIGSDAEQK